MLLFFSLEKQLFQCYAVQGRFVLSSCSFFAVDSCSVYFNDWRGWYSCNLLLEWFNRSQNSSLLQVFKLSKFCSNFLSNFCFSFLHGAQYLRFSLTYCPLRKSLLRYLGVCVLICLIGLTMFTFLIAYIFSNYLYYENSF